MNDRITRRRWLGTLTIASVVPGFAGCISAEDDDNADSRETDQDAEDGEDSGETSDQIEIEYSVSDPRSHDEVPDEVIEHPNPEDFRWIVVDFELISGTFDAADIMGLTQIEVNGESQFTRAVVINSPDDELLTSSDDNYTMGEGTRAEAYYRVSGDAEEGRWIVDQLENQHGEIEIREG